MRIGPMAVGRDRTKGQPDSKVAAGWSALRELAGTMIRERSFFRSGWAFLKQNKPVGFACVSCAWTKPAKPLPMEICESGGKASAWELTRKKVPLHFFDQHSLRELETWKDHDLENLGRLTHPLKYRTCRARAARYGLQHSGKMLRRILPRMQRPDPVVALCQGEQDPGSKARACARTRGREDTAGWSCERQSPGGAGPRSRSIA